MGSGDNMGSSVLPQFLATIAANLGAFGLGLGLAWTSPALPRLSDCEPDHCDLPTSFTAEEASWIAGLLSLGAAISCLVGGQYMIPKFGCRWTMILLSIPSVIGCVCLVLPKPLEMQSPALFYAGRFLVGLGGGGFAVAAPKYVTEIAEVRVWGALGSMFAFMCTLGIVVVNAMSIKEAVNWLGITAMCLAIPVLNAGSLLFMPDSPSHLLTSDKVKAAEKSLRWLRGSKYTGLEGELQTMQGQIQEDLREKKPSLLKLFTSSVYLKPLSISMSLMFLQQFSGINGILSYLQTIFIKTGSTMDIGLSSFLASLAQLLGTAMAIFLIDKLGRKILLVASDAFMCLSIGSMGIYFWMDSNIKCAGIELLNRQANDSAETGCIVDGKFDREDIEAISWLPLASLILYLLAFSIGFGPIPWTMNVELFPKEALSVFSSTAGLFNWFMSFVVTKFTPNFENLLGLDGLYFMYSAICGLGVLFIIFVVPETKGKTPEDMKRYFSGTKQTTR